MSEQLSLFPDNTGNWNEVDGKVQASNMSKACTTEEEAIQAVSQRSKEQGEACHFEKVKEGRYIVYRSRDRKVMKSTNYFRPDLHQFFTGDELARFRNESMGI